ncbi:MAG: hypothetical protein NXH75_03770 [Halobacteriovoraceae bacterium]|nr:hypothetical protein [Halobacteriovoraceae bacterium]
MKVKIFKYIKLIFFLFGGISNSYSLDCSFKSKVGSNDQLILLQTQVTALKLASLIDIYENPRNANEREKSLDALSALKSPLSKNHPLVQAFSEGAYTTLLSETYKASLDLYVEGKLPISYESMPQLLMALEFSHGNPLFDKRDFAVAEMWNDKSIFDTPINPMLGNLTSIYHDLNKEERERLYSQIHPKLQMEWDKVKEELNSPECLPLVEEQNLECSDSAKTILGAWSDQFNKLSFDVLDIVNFSLIDSLSTNLEDKVDWVLHPPPLDDDYHIPGFNLTRKFKGKDHTEYRNQRIKIKELEKQDDLSLIKTHHLINELGAYLVLNKKKDRVYLFDEDGILLGSVEAGLKLQTTGDKRSDQAMREARGMGAGIYSLDKVEDSFMDFSDQRNRSNFLKLTTTGVSCDEETCSQLVSSLEDLLKSHTLNLPLPFYILPNDEDFEFVIKNNNLSFTTYEKGLPYFDYNFTPKSRSAFPTEYTIENPEYDTPFARDFLKTLEEEKQNLMKLYNLDNDEYNELVILAFGILGQESQFSKHWRYKVKETFPGGVAYLKNYKNIFGEFGNNRKKEGFWGAVGTFISDSWENEWDYFTGRISTKQNSRGPTQIKKIPALIKKEYGVGKEDLDEPQNAAVATLGFLAQSLEELRAKEKFHPDINGKNRFDYIHYIYMGLSHEITQGTATPEKNIYFQNLKKYSSSLRIWQNLEN